MWRSFLAISYKEFIHAFRDVGLVRTLIIMQMVQLLALGFIDTELRDTPTVVVDQDFSSESRLFVQKLEATRAFDIKYHTNSVTQAREMIRAGKARIGVVIPPDFHRDRARGKGATVLAIIDGSDHYTAGHATGTIGGLIASMNMQRQEEIAVTDQLPLSMRTLTLFNPLDKNSNYMLPGMIVMVMQIFISLSAVALVKERMNGTLERLLMTPVDFTGLMLGKMAPYWVVGMLNAIVLLLVIRWLFGVPITGNIPLLLFSYGLYLLCMLSIGLFFASNAPAIPQVNQKVTLFSLPAFFLTGYIFPIAGLPKWLIPIAYMHPITHQLEITRGIILRGADVIDLLPNVAYMAIVSVVLISLSVRRFKATLYN